MGRKKGDLRSSLAALDDACKAIEALLEQHAVKLRKANDKVAAEVKRAQVLLGGQPVMVRASVVAPPVPVEPDEIMGHTPEQSTDPEEERRLMEAAMAKAGITPKESKETLAQRLEREQHEFLNSVRPGRQAKLAAALAARRPSPVPDLPGPIIEPSAQEDA